MKDLLFRNILCPLDINDPPRRSLEFVRRLSNTQSGLNINFLYIDQFIPVIQYPQQTLQHVYDGSINTGQLKDKNDILKDMIVNEFTSKLNFSVYVDSGDIASMINRYAIKLHVDLIVIENHARDTLFDLFTQSIPQKILKYSSCPVIIVS